MPASRLKSQCFHINGTQCTIYHLRYGFWAAFVFLALSVMEGPFDVKGSLSESAAKRASDKRACSTDPTDDIFITH